VARLGHGRLSRCVLTDCAERMGGVLGVSDFTAGVIAALIGAVVGGAFAIVAGVVAGRVEARRTEEIALELRRRERLEEAMWELAHRLEDIRTALVEGRTGIGVRFEQLNGRWRTHIAPAIRSGPIARGYAEVRRLGDEAFGAQAAYGTDTGPLLAALDALFAEIQAETGGEG
jgi:hypothetical protein